MSSLLLETVCWAVVLVIALIQRDCSFGWWSASMLAACLLRAPVVAVEEERSKARIAEFDARWAELSSRSGTDGAKERAMLDQFAQVMQRGDGR